MFTGVLFGLGVWVCCLNCFGFDAICLLCLRYNVFGFSLVVLTGRLAISCRFTLCLRLNCFVGVLVV